MKVNYKFKVFYVILELKPKIKSKVLIFSIYNFVNKILDMVQYAVVINILVDKVVKILVFRVHVVH